MSNTSWRVGLAIACTFVATSALAQSGPGYEYGGGYYYNYPYPDDDPIAIPPSNSLEGRELQWTLSKVVIGGVNAIYGSVIHTGTGPYAAVGGAAFTPVLGSRGRVIGASWSGPLTSVQGIQADGRPNRVTAGGGLRLQVESDDFTNHGGSLTLSNWTIDAASMRVLADVDGANGVGHQEDVAVFKLREMSVMPGLEGYASGQTTFNAFAFTDAGLELFSNALGLTDIGRSVPWQFHSVGTLQVGVALSPVPEPTGLALAMGGLLSLGWLKRRRQMHA